MMNRAVAALIVPILAITCSGCISGPYYQKAEAIPNNLWDNSYRPTFEFDITDTTAAYHTFFLFRHTQAYPFANVWLMLYIKKPNDSTIIKERVNVPLAEQSGKWLGRGMGEIYEQRMRISLGDSVKFNRRGTYKISVEQNMRINPLPEVLQAGFMIEKEGPKMPTAQQ
jgi:gliding motility-associated lipoprotein GldH